MIEQRRNLALDANTRPTVINALDALTLAPEKFTPEAGVYLSLRSIYWSLVRAKTDDDLRDVAQRLLREDHVLVLPCGERSIRFRPALDVTESELEFGLAALDRTLTTLAR